MQEMNAIALLALINMLFRLLHSQIIIVIETC